MAETPKRNSKIGEILHPKKRVVGCPERVGCLSFQKKFGEIQILVKF
jgi:hypothetical protein